MGTEQDENLDIELETGLEKSPWMCRLAGMWKLNRSPWTEKLTGRIPWK